MHSSASPTGRPRSAGVIARRSPQFNTPQPPPVASCCRPPTPHPPLAIRLIHACVTSVAGGHLALALIRGAALRAPPPSLAHLAPAAAAAVAAAAVAGGKLGEATAAALATIAGTLGERDEGGRLAAAVAAVRAHHAAVREARAQEAATVDESDVQPDAEPAPPPPAQPEATTTTTTADALADPPPAKRRRPSPAITLTVRAGPVSPTLTALELDALAGLAGMEDGREA